MKQPKSKKSIKSKRIIRKPKFDDGKPKYVPEVNDVPEVVITPDTRPVARRALARAQKAIPDKLLRYDIAVDNMSTDVGAVSANKQLSNLLDIYDMSGRPNIIAGPTGGNAKHSRAYYKWKNFWHKLGLAKDYTNEYNSAYGRSCYTKNDNTIHLTASKQFIPEVAHAYQRNNNFMEGESTGGTGYEMHGTSEYNAHQGIEPAMMQLAAYNKMRSIDKNYLEGLAEENARIGNTNFKQTSRAGFSDEDNTKYYDDGKLQELDPNSYGIIEDNEPIIIGNRKKRNSLSLPSLRDILASLFDPKTIMNNYMKDYITSMMFPNGNPTKLIIRNPFESNYYIS